MRISDWSSDVCSSDLLRPISAMKYASIDVSLLLSLSMSIYSRRDCIGLPAACRRGGRPVRLLDAFQYAPAHLIQFDGFEQGLEVAFAKAFVAFALDNFEKNRADLILGENLQQQAAFDCAVQQDLVLAQAIHIFAMIGQAQIQQLGRAHVELQSLMRI